MCSPRPAAEKPFEPMWDVVIRARQLPVMTPLPEGPDEENGPKSRDLGPFGESLG